MTDLINKINNILKTDINSIQILVNKYRNILELTELKLKKQT